MAEQRVLRTVAIGRAVAFSLSMLGACVLAACDDGHPPDLRGLTDQTAAVGNELVIQLDGTDPDGGKLTYSVQADFLLQGATITQTPTGTGVFRWTPLAPDVGAHVFDFTVSDGSHKTTVSINVNVLAAIPGAPVFQQPLGTGEVVNVVTTPCMTVQIVIMDADSATVTIAQEAPLIDGATLAVVDGLDATWTWCPTTAQVAAQDRYTLVLSADDGTNPKTIKDYVIVLAGNGPHLVINELDYDQVGTDGAEFIEIYNPGSSMLSLAGLALVLVNGANSTVYNTIDLSPAGQLPPQGYLVVAGSTVNVAPSSLRLDPVATQDWIQNGAPDGLALVDNVTQTVVDALSYEGAVSAVTITGFPAPISLVEGTVLPTSVSDSNTSTRTLCRFPNGQDSDNAATDWAECATLTPGTSNIQ
jgi:hypothetical protein